MDFSCRLVTDATLGSLLSSVQLILLAFPGYCWGKEKRGTRAELSCCCFGLEEGREGGRQAGDKQPTAPTFVLRAVWLDLL